MMQPKEVYEDKMTEKEIAFITELMERDNIGYFKVLRFICIVCFIIAVIVGLIASIATPQNKLEEKFSIENYIIGATVALLFILAATIYGKKRFSWKYKADLKHNFKQVIAMSIQQKQFVELSQTFHFHLNYPGLNSIQVSLDDFKSYQVGDIIHIEFAKYSQTYLGYF